MCLKEYILLMESAMMESQRSPISWKSFFRTLGVTMIPDTSVWIASLRTLSLDSSRSSTTKAYRILSVMGSTLRDKARSHSGSELISDGLDEKAGVTGVQEICSIFSMEKLLPSSKGKWIAVTNEVFYADWDRFVSQYFHESSYYFVTLPLDQVEKEQRDNIEFFLCDCLLIPSISSALQFSILENECFKSFSCRWIERFSKSLGVIFPLISYHLSLRYPQRFAKLIDEGWKVLRHVVRRWKLFSHFSHSSGNRETHQYCRFRASASQSESERKRKRRRRKGLKCRNRRETEENIRFDSGALRERRHGSALPCLIRQVGIRF